jgi:hypothetical protein
MQPEKATQKKITQKTATAPGPARTKRRATLRIHSTRHGDNYIPSGSIPDVIRDGAQSPRRLLHLRRHP